MKPASARHRTDTTARALEAELKRLGASWKALGGTVDGVAWLGSAFRLVDWKTPGQSLTDEQARLVAQGCPVVFCSTVDQVQALVAALKREAWR